MSSKWAESDSDSYFKSRDHAVRFCQQLLDQQHIVGGQKIEVQQKAKKDEDKDEEEEESKKVWLMNIKWVCHSVGGVT